VSAAASVGPINEDIISSSHHEWQATVKTFLGRAGGAGQPSLVVQLEAR